jgi:FlaA1/EpsC-like NDP-sugar epimerase
MIKKKLINYNDIEKKIISNIDRFKLSTKEIVELKKDLENAVILVSGATGSIGKHFVEKIVNLNFKTLFLLDKNENELTDLNRDLLIKYEKKNLRYICSDINNLDFINFFKLNKITHYFNFAAIKHVRSEEEFESIKYMLKTNAKNFLPGNNLKKNFFLKKIFSVSTDKAVNPKSFLGVTKNLMEKKLKNFQINNPGIFVSSARFANVSFSNGSILKFIVERIIQKKSFGIPDKIFRYFITHDEAVSLCFKALQINNNGCILVPAAFRLGKQISIKDICIKLLKFFNQEYSIKKNYIIVDNSFKIFFNRKITSGQKISEEIYSINELIHQRDNFSINIKLKSCIIVDKLINSLIVSRNKLQMYKILRKNFLNFMNINASKNKISKII